LPDAPPPLAVPLPVVAPPSVGPEVEDEAEVVADDDDVILDVSSSIAAQDVARRCP
jgi:hypothetical protein